MKVHVYPAFGGEDQGDGGVRRVVERQLAHFPDYGIEPSREQEADLIACHITAPTTYLRLYPRTPLVAHCHGLYWAEYPWPAWALKANVEVMELLRVADAITAPSEWVAQIIRRHLARPVEVVHHGVDLAEWAVDETVENHGYVLWNKTRPDPVCDPAPMNAVAALLPDVLFISTFGEKASNIAITDRQPYEKAKTLVKSAGIYLCTTKETFGIGTLEALAAGVPVVGFRHGGQVEIIEHGVDGWLAAPGDLEDLAAGIRWAIANRASLSPKCVEKAGRFTWERAAAKYAALYERTHEAKTRKRPKVSVIVPAYKLDRYLPETLESIRAQTLGDFECIVVDDASPDRCGQIADEYASLDPRFKAIHNRTNQFHSASRNIGMETANGEYILPLDADDKIAPTTLEVLAHALDRDRTIQIAYGGVRFVNEDGQTPTDYRIEGQTPGHSGWPLPFSFEGQARGLNYPPIASMFRREVWECTGGYRRRCRTGEDADLWLRASSYGFRPVMVTTEDTLIYRNREGSVSRTENPYKWVHWYPWGAAIDLAPAGALTREQLPVPSYDPPAISVVIPVGPGHEHLVIDAVDSVEAQSFRAWECIVVNDTGGPLPRLPAWVKIVTTEGRRGVAAARNAGIRQARGTFFVPLDADDLLQPDALQWFATAAEMHPGEIIYCDFFEDPHTPDVYSVYETPDYNPSVLLRRGALHPVTALTPRSAWETIGGYDETAPCWEDWLFQLAAIDNGICSRRLAAPLFTYRKFTGARRESNQVDFERCKQAVQDRFGKFWRREKDIMGCGCTANPTTQSPVTGMMAARHPGTPTGAVLVRYVGLRTGSVSFRGIDTGTVYTFAANEPPRWVYESDLETFRRKPRDYEILGPAPVALEAGEVLKPTLVAEDLAGRDFEGLAPSGAMNAMRAAESMVVATGGVALAERPEAGPAYNSIEEVPEDVRIRALMGLGMSRDEAEKRVRG